MALKIDKSWVRTNFVDDNPYCDLPHGLIINPYMLFDVWMCDSVCYGRKKWGTLADKLSVVWYSKDRTNSGKYHPLFIRS